MPRTDRNLLLALARVAGFPIIIFSILLFIAPFSANADTWNWHILPDSTLTFRFTQSGSELEGRFDRFSATIELNPAAAEGGTISAIIDTTSINTENANRDTLLQSQELFDTGRWPQATFATETISRQPNGSYAAEAILTIRDVSRPVTLPFTLDITGTQAVATGALTILRSDFGIGQGQWAGTDIVADPVTIHILIHANRGS